MSGKITTYGFEGYIAKLEAFGKSDAAAEKALIAGAKIVQDKVKPKIRRSQANKEHAADHIVISKVKKKKGVLSVTVGPEGGGNGKFFYLNYYENGTHNPNALGKVVPAEHMFSSTCAEQKAAVRDAMTEVFEEETHV